MVLTSQGHRLEWCREEGMETVKNIIALILFFIFKVADRWG